MEDDIQAEDEQNREMPVPPTPKEVREIVAKKVVFAGKSRNHSNLPVRKETRELIDKMKKQKRVGPETYTKFESYDEVVYRLIQENRELWDQQQKLEWMAQSLRNIERRLNEIDPAFVSPKNKQEVQESSTNDAEFAKEMLAPDPNKPFELEYRTVKEMKEAGVHDADLVWKYKGCPICELPLDVISNMHDILLTRTLTTEDAAPHFGVRLVDLDRHWKLEKHHEPPKKAKAKE